MMQFPMLPFSTYIFFFFASNDHMHLRFKLDFRIVLNINDIQSFAAGLSLSLCLHLPFRKIVINIISFLFSLDFYYFFFNSILSFSFVITFSFNLFCHIFFFVFFLEIIYNFLFTFYTLFCSTINRAENVFNLLIC